MRVEAEGLVWKMDETLVLGQVWGPLAAMILSPGPTWQQWETSLVVTPGPGVRAPLASCGPRRGCCPLTRSDLGGQWAGGGRGRCRAASRADRTCRPPDSGASDKQVSKGPEPISKLCQHHQAAPPERHHQLCC